MLTVQESADSTRHSCIRTIIPTITQIYIGTHTILSIGEHRFTQVTAGGIHLTITVGMILSIGLGILHIGIIITIATIITGITITTIYATTIAMTTTQTYTEEYQQGKAI